MKKYAVCVYGYGANERLGLTSVVAQFDTLKQSLAYQDTLLPFKFPMNFEVWDTKKLSLVYKAEWMTDKKKWTER